jgi:hypothetical protein
MAGIDRREQIIARIVLIAGGLPGVKTVERNKTQISERQRPAIVVLDGNEEGAVGEFALGRPAITPKIISMMPEVWLMVGGPKETVGSALNELRAAVVRAILEDFSLQDFVGETGGYQYQGCVTDLTLGEQSEGLMGLHFAFHYPLRSSELDL